MVKETVNTGGLRKFVYGARKKEIKRKNIKNLKSIFTIKDNQKYCAKCGGEYLGFTDKHDCKYCNKYYCEDHQLPENHDCNWLKEYKRKGEERWKNAFTSSTNYRFEKQDKKESNSLKIEHKQNDKKRNIQNKITNYFLNKYKNLIYWLNKRDYHKYYYEERMNYLITTILIFFASIVGISIFYSNASKLNEINLWIIKLGGVLILTSLFFAIKFGLRLGKEGINILKRQRNWLKYLVIILVVFLLWQMYTNKDTVLNPVFNIYDKTNFSLISPLDFGDFNGEITKDHISKNKSDSIISNFDNLYYGLEEGETRVKDIGFLHFNKVPVYYKMEDCIGERRERVIQAFNIIEEQTSGILSFKEKASEDIIIKCHPQRETELASGYGGPEYYVGSNEITRGFVDLYAHDSQFSRCESYPVTEIHEILHALGINHIPDKNSIMYEGDTSSLILEYGESDQPYVCIKMESKISNCLKYIYSSGVEETSCSGIPFIG